MIKRLGIRYRRPYNMRHNYATAMLMAGMTPAFCAKQLGHSVGVFSRTYAKWLNGGKTTWRWLGLKPPSLLRAPQRNALRVSDW